VNMRVEAVLGDLTAQRLDAIVNAANATLLGGGGVDGTIHAAAGPDLLKACRDVRRTVFPDGLPTGDAVATTAGRLPARYVIHTVGPRSWEHGDEGALLLASCHERSLEVAEELRLHSVAFPAVSCGAYGWAPAEAAPIAVGAVRAFADRHPETSIELVRFVLFTEAALVPFAEACASVLE
jgi:O-acetyl-ADP-ribose deacetylase (regulator of RNase III)